ncbi:hypothetical protein DTO280E4_2698 [Paecilomyces variotii]|nr:hypothetical protein DTO207G8_3841 [Paecilomyces variotii]KAJ9271390.1 hypothetical protein DTO212C5_2470 [Paecilomyces variotii]KAJ9363290.1 hypothetical protein DTO280E4_2698 [Paecilomyces variotii]KAJ9387572.1 hypothetical protein DTO063F5_3136 [Paecilomyces variotii]
MILCCPRINIRFNVFQVSESDLRNAPRPELQLDITYLRHLTICSRDTSTVNHLHHYLTLCGITAQKHIHTTI